MIKKPEKKKIIAPTDENAKQLNISILGNFHNFIGYNQGLADMEAYYTQPSDVDEGLKEVLKWLYSKGADFYGEGVTTKDINKDVKDRVDEAISQIKILFIKKEK